MAKTYKCPGCGAPLVFEPGADELVCEYCDTHVQISDLKESDSEPETEEKQDFHGYVCQSCGAQLIVDEYTASTTCCYCGSHAVIQERLEGVQKPAGVIPFEINKERARELYKNWLCKGLFTPSVFKKAATLENIRGIYVPFWLYDYEAEAHVEAECTRVRTERRGDTEYVHTDYYYVARHAKSNYHKIPVDASERMPDSVMDMMEPYRYEGLKTFEMPYLSGYESEKYNFESNDGQMTQRVENRVNQYMTQDVRETIKGYSSTTFRRNDISLTRKNAMYTLLPVWLVTYRYKGENKIFTINGQTGKQVGELPNSQGKMVAWFAGITISIMAILLLLGGLFG